jgi:hypothetical protein
MLRSLALLGFVLIASPAAAQNTCDAKCNQQASECLKACTGDPKDAQKPGESQRLMDCIKQCEAKTTACKAGCGGKK